jgi:hypothetical protein
MKPKTRYILKREDRVWNTVDINMYEEPEIKKIFLSEKKDMYKKWYVLITQAPIRRVCWKQFAQALSVCWKVTYYYVISKQAWTPPSEQKEVSKYYYTISLLRTNVKIIEEKKEYDIDDDDIDRDDLEYGDDDDDVEEEIEYDDDDDIEEEIEFDPNNY